MESLLLDLEELENSIEVTQPSPIQSLKKRCLICDDQNDGNHFGIDSCRACAAFFRRSVTGAKTYHCRQGRNSCKVSKTMKSMCRRCRLTKCLVAGMKPENVRDPINSKTDPNWANTSAFQIAFHRVNPMVNIPEDGCADLLTTIFKEYRQLCSVRKATELAMSGQSAKGFFSNQSLIAGYSPSTFAKVSLYYRAHIPATADFISNCFPVFNDLSADDKWALFRSFMIHLWALDNNFRSFKHVPPELQERYCLMTETTYCDLENIGTFLEEGMKEQAKQEMLKLVPKVLAPLKHNICKPMCDIKIEDEEYAFLLGLILWEIDVEKINPSVEELGKTLRESLYRSIEAYYLKQGKIRFSTRLGEIHSIHCSLIQFVSLLREYSELFNLVDAYELDSFIHDFIRM